MTHIITQRERTRPDTNGLHIVFVQDSRVPQTAYDAIRGLDTDSFGYLDYTDRRLTDEELEAIKQFRNHGGQTLSIKDGSTFEEEHIKMETHQEWGDNGVFWWEIDHIWWED